MGIKDKESLGKLSYGVIPLPSNFEANLIPTSLCYISQVTGQ